LANPDVISIVSSSQGRMIEINDPLHSPVSLAKKLLDTWQSGRPIFDPVELASLRQCLASDKIVRNLEIELHKKDGSAITCAKSPAIDLRTNRDLED
jgi:hypothetical protein